MKKTDVVRDLIEIKELIHDGGAAYSVESSESLLRRINELDEKLEKMNAVMSKQPVPSFAANVPKYDSPVKTKRKETIVNILAYHRKLTSVELSSLTGISRTRCNEYLKELELDGITKGVIIDKKKYYRLVRWEKSLE